ncbi:MAG: hypothetical protein ACODAD_11450 [Planctomycetota bacterium]
MYPERSSPISDVVRIMIREPLSYCVHENDREVRERNRELAALHWRELGAAGRQVPEPRADYRAGFIEGFSDYLYAGGTGAPPPIPPRRYWNTEYQSRQGRAAVEAWFSGFRHGTAACRVAGLRDLMVVPSSTLGVPADPRINTSHHGHKRGERTTDQSRRPEKASQELLEELPVGPAELAPNKATENRPPPPQPPRREEKTRRKPSDDALEKPLPVPPPGFQQRPPAGERGAHSGGFRPATSPGAGSFGLVQPRTVKM